ncbi:hypothetical protein G7B40_022920 [Aetokthonos hydrillicola Thurmond2011]|jgi:hypothetical protein|uniref:Uncharacterized protein n=1 Tax=Aetokthonos hydrillicola Thurmond2011 TaxID=2712845 RepID=A0AAP5I9E5_9CYAN|nr:hypothetical protein [Aetokthonos hydrillicola]MBO3464016.1 hypothetical protein [Aetokthonos hydrillicola CCALA 1050]MBW4586271.1 hypothetical protein [Aetokthonos hydrillicola CCALA 1050]MDR9897397.1 hypothetical protein [Aetokthonos hydrillicola Thurmond2011]
MKINRLQELKQKLTNEADLSDIWSFYMDHFADHPEFTDLGEPAYNEYLDAVVHKTCQQIFGKAIKIANFLLIYIPKYRLFHGPFQVNGRIGGVIYFEDIKIGLLAVSADNPPTDAVKYSRFSEIIQLSAPNRNDLN